MADPYGRSTYDGNPLDNATIAAIKEAEARLGYKLTIVQGIGGAAASAGTHTEGRAVDLVDWDTTRKLRVLKDVGFAVWKRATLPGVWGSHIHGILILERRDNSRGLADAGFRQIAAFDARRDGLIGNRPDLSYRPDPRVEFHYPPKEVPVAVEGTKVTQARDELARALHQLGRAAALLDDADPQRVRAKEQIDNIRALRQDVRGVLEALPPK